MNRTQGLIFIGHSAGADPASYRKWYGALAAKGCFMNVACPFCTSVNQPLRGDGCCFCDYTGMIPEVEHRRILDPNAKNDEEYPFLSDIDLKAGRKILKEKAGQPG